MCAQSSTAQSFAVTLFLRSKFFMVLDCCLKIPCTGVLLRVCTNLWEFRECKFAGRRWQPARCASRLCHGHFRMLVGKHVICRQTWDLLPCFLADTIHNTGSSMCVMHLVQIRRIRGLSCANLGFMLCIAAVSGMSTCWPMHYLMWSRVGIRELVEKPSFLHRRREKRYK